MNEEEKKEIQKELNEILDSREDEILENYPKVREAFQTPYGWPEIDTLRHEASLCIIFGLHQAAITFINHMVENFLKNCLGYKEAFDNYDESDHDTPSVDNLAKWLKPSFEKHDDKNLYDTIELSFKKDIITEDQKDKLHQIREKLRNAYSHAQKGKIHGDTEIPIQGLHLNDENQFEVEPESDQLITALPFIQGQSQYYHAKANSVPYFKYVDNLVRETMPKIFPNAGDE